MHTGDTQIRVYIVAFPIVVGRGKTMGIIAEGNNKNSIICFLGLFGGTPFVPTLLYTFTILDIYFFFKCIMFFICNINLI